MIEFWVNNKDYVLPILIGLCFAIFGFYQNYKVETIRRDGIKTVAEIVDYEERYNSSDTSPIMYYPIIRFIDNNGTGRQIIDSIGTSWRPDKKLPFKFNIHYIQNEGEFEMVTESKSNDIIAMGFLITGLIIVIVTLFLFFNK